MYHRTTTDNLKRTALVAITTAGIGLGALGIGPALANAAPPGGGRPEDLRVRAALLDIRGRVDPADRVDPDGPAPADPAGPGMAPVRTAGPASSARPLPHRRRLRTSRGAGITGDSAVHRGVKVRRRGVGARRPGRTGIARCRRRVVTGTPVRSTTGVTT